MKYIVLLGLLILFCTCSGRTGQTTVVTAFPVTGKLNAYVQKIPEPLLLPRYMCVSDEYLFVYKEKESMLFEIFHLPDGAYLCTAGMRGQGPSDFGLLDTRSFEATEKGFKVMEAGSNLLKTVVFENNRLSITQSDKMFVGQVFNNGFYSIGDSVYLTLGNIGESEEYGLYDKKTGTFTKTGEYPRWTAASDDPIQIFFIYLKSCVVHPGGKKFAAFYSRFKRIRIYEQMKLLHDVEVRIAPCSTEIQDSGMALSVYYTGQPQVIGKYIYALCSNSKEEKTDLPNACELHVWDWSGNPVACYQFDRKISLMTLSEKHNKIYALDLSIDNELYVYDIPDLKK
jgi:hypothetical protein